MVMVVMMMTMMMMVVVVMVMVMVLVVVVVMIQVKLQRNSASFFRQIYTMKNFIEKRSTKTQWLKSIYVSMGFATPGVHFPRVKTTVENQLPSKKGWFDTGLWCFQIEDYEVKTQQLSKIYDVHTSIWSVKKIGCFAMKGMMPTFLGSRCSIYIYIIIYRHGWKLGVRRYCGTFIQRFFCEVGRYRQKHL